MIQDKIFFDEKDPTGLSYNTPFTYFGSYQGRLWSKAPGGEIKYYTQNSDLSVYATTGSNQFNGNQAITGSLTVTGGIIGTTATSSYVEYSNVANKPTLVSGSSQISFSGITNKPTLVSGSSQVSFNGITNKPTLVSGSAQVAQFGYAITGSNQFKASQAITGSLVVTQQIVAQTLNVQQVTSSIVYSSGSNIFGNNSGNTQQFTGSLQVTGSSHYLLGSVGVGIATPTNPLHIQSNTLSQLNVTALSGNTNAQINLEPTGTGIALIGPANNVDLAFRTNATIKLRLDKDGNLGLGVTPSAWSTSFGIKVIDIGNQGTFYASDNDVNVSFNQFFNGTNAIYKTTGTASRFALIGNEFQWRQAPSGTAGNAITFTQAMTLYSTGNLVIGTTTDNGARLQVSGEGRFTNSDGADLIRYAATGVNTNFATKIVSGANDVLVFRRQHVSSGALDIMSLGFNGNVGIGTIIPGAKLEVNGTGPGLGAGINIPNIFVSGASGFQSIGFRRDADSNGGWFIGTSHSVVGDFGIYQNQGASAPSNRLSISTSGNVLIGTASDNGNKLRVEGDTFTNGRFALPFGSVRTYSAVGNIVINVGNLETLTGNNWRQISLMIFCTGVGDGLEFSYQNVVFVRIRGLSSWNGMDVFDIVGGASISLSNNTTTGFRLTLNVNAAARGSAMVMLASVNSAGQLS